MKYKKKYRAIALIMLICILLSGCGKPTPKRYQAEFLTLFDTVTRIVGFSTDGGKDFSAIAQKAYDKLEVYHKLYDIYNEYEGIANIRTINNNAGIAAVTVDQKIIDLLLFAKEMYNKTDGAVNIAFGAVLELWHDAREAGIDDPENAKLPKEEELKAAAEHCDINNIVIDEEKSTVYLTDTKMSLDVGAIAKGYAVEMTARALEDEGVNSLLISVGGNVRAIGSKYNTESGKYDIEWQVGIQDPENNDNELFSVLINAKSVVTSGIYERYYTVDGVQYHHIIDPNTLFPSNNYVSLTVVCEDSGLADAMTTALFNLPPEKSAALVKKIPGVEACFVMSDGNIVYSDGFKSLIKK